MFFFFGGGCFQIIFMYITYITACTCFHKLSAPLLVGAVREINGLFGANCSKAIKFGPDVDRALLGRFRVVAKKGIALRHYRGQIKNGRHYMSEISELSNIIIQILNYIISNSLLRSVIYDPYVFYNF